MTYHIIMIYHDISYILLSHVIISYHIITLGHIITCDYHISHYHMWLSHITLSHVIITYQIITCDYNIYVIYHIFTCGYHISSSSSPKLVICETMVAPCPWGHSIYFIFMERLFQLTDIQNFNSLSLFKLIFSNYIH